MNLSNSDAKMPKSSLNLVLPLFLIFSSCAGTPETAGSGNLDLVALKTAGDCARMDSYAPTPDQLEDLALRRVAEACLERAEQPSADARLLDTAAAAFNAAQGFSELARRTGNGTYHAKTDRASALSRRVLGDLNNDLTGRGDAARRLTYQRLALQIASQLHRGLSTLPEVSISCGGQQTCLRSARRLFDDNASVLAIGAEGSYPGASSDHSRLQLLLARGEAKLAEFESSDQGIDLALNNLAEVITRESAAGSGNQGLAAEARRAFADIVDAEATRLLEKERSERTARRAISLLSRGEYYAGATRPDLSVHLGMAHETLARMTRASLQTQDRKGHLCSAAEAYTSAIGSGSMLSNQDRASALAGRGAALAQLSLGSLGGCQNGVGTATRERARDDFRQAWDLAANDATIAPDREHAETYADLLADLGEFKLASEVRRMSGSTTGTGAMELFLANAARAGSKTEAVALFRQAKSAYPPSPKPELELAKYLYRVGHADKREIDAELAGAIADADAERSYAAVEAEAYYYRSLNAEQAINAERWARAAVQGDSTNACYEYQACRARLRVGSIERGAGRGECAANPQSGEGAVLDALGRLREAQLERIARPNNSLSAFIPASDAFRDAQSKIRQETTANAQASASCETSGPSFALDRVARYGAIFAQACSTPQNEAAPALPNDLREVRAYFDYYGFERCNQVP